MECLAEGVRHQTQLGFRNQGQLPDLCLHRVAKLFPKSVTGLHAMVNGQLFLFRCPQQGEGS